MGLSVTSALSVFTVTCPLRTKYTFSVGLASRSAPPPGRKWESPIQKLCTPVSSFPWRRIAAILKCFAASYSFASLILITFMVSPPFKLLMYFVLMFASLLAVAPLDLNLALHLLKGDEL